MTRDLYRVSLAAALIGCGDNGGKLETTGSMPDPQTVTSEGAGHEATGAPTTGMMGIMGMMTPRFQLRPQLCRVELSA